MKAINLDKLNDNQRAAVVFGVEPDRLPPPLLVIAGAGSGNWPALVEALTTRTGWPEAMDQARIWYEPHLERIHEDAEYRRGDLSQLEQIAAGYPSRERFLTELTLDPPEATGGHAGVPFKDEDYLILSTIHSAKGQEWKSVFILNAVDGCIPSDLGAGTSDEIEEERRLLYVAMTRAKDNLTLGSPLRFYVPQQARNGDRHLYATRTRFIPKEILDRFEPVYCAPKVSGSVTVAPSPAPIDVSAKMHGIWGE